MNDIIAFSRLIVALEPWLDHLVFIGGWAHRLYRFHPTSTPPQYFPITTRDADIAFEISPKIEGDIKQALLNAGFSEELSGNHQPAISQYSLGEENTGFYVEFLAPQRGSGRRRDGSIVVTAAQAGVTAQLLRHLDILLFKPWSVNISDAQGFELDSPRHIQIANPVAFISQKLLIHDQRGRGKKSQDIMYIHDTLELFIASLGTLNDVWRDGICEQSPERIAKRVMAIAHEVFVEVNDAIRDAAQIDPGRNMRPEAIRQFCDVALDTIFNSRGKG